MMKTKLIGIMSLEYCSQRKMKPGSKLTLFMVAMVMMGQMGCPKASKISKNGIAILNKQEQRLRHTYAKIQCDENILSNASAPNDGEAYCPPVWDGIMCWNFTLADTIGTQPCPHYVNRFFVHGVATRTCTRDAEWLFYPDRNRTWTNFSLCMSSGKPVGDDTNQHFQVHLPYLKIMYTIGYGLSLVSLVAAIFIMIYFKKLHCTRNTIHVNLFLAFVLHAICNLLRDSLFVQGAGFQSDVNVNQNGHVEFIEEGSHWQCKLLITFTYYAMFTTYMWVFVEAIYLCVLLFIAVFSGKNYTAYYIVLGWTAPLLFMIPWVFVRIYYEDEFCWNKHQIRGFFWIINTPIVLIILTNFIVFLAIVWFLLTKLQARNSNTPEARKYRYRKLARSTLVLIPLFGVYYIFTVGIPEKMDSEVAEVVVLYINLFFNSYQGFVVAMLFCFLNGEVRSEFKKKISRLTEDGLGGRRSHRPTWATVSTYVSKARNSLYSSHSTAAIDKSESVLINGIPSSRSRNNYTLSLPSSDNISSVAVVEQNHIVPSEKLAENEREEAKRLINQKEESVV